MLPENSSHSGKLIIAAFGTRMDVIESLAKKLSNWWIFMRTFVWSLAREGDEGGKKVSDGFFLEAWQKVTFQHFLRTWPPRKPKAWRIGSYLNLDLSLLSLSLRVIFHPKFHVNQMENSISDWLDLIRILCCMKPQNEVQSQPECVVVTNVHINHKTLISSFHINHGNHHLFALPIVATIFHLQNLHSSPKKKIKFHSLFSNPDSGD